MIAGARVERFDQEVNTFDPFGLFVRTITAENKNTDFFPAVNFVQAMAGNSNLRLSYGATVNRPEFRELAEFEFTDVVGSRASKGNPNSQRALIHNVDGRWEMFTGAAASSPRACSTSTSTSRSSASCSRRPRRWRRSRTPTTPAIRASSWKLARDLGRHFFVNANYTFVDSKITLLPNQLATQTSLERPLAGQSKNLFNMTFEGTAGGFAGRLLFNYFGDRISDVGANDAPDILEQGRGSLDSRPVPARQRPEHPADAGKPDRQRVQVHAGQRADPQRTVQARAESSRFHSATTSSKRHSYGAFKDHYEEINCASLADSRSAPACC